MPSASKMEKIFRQNDEEVRKNGRYHYWKDNFTRSSLLPLSAVYTDEELMAKYGLTRVEINSIESEERLKSNQRFELIKAQVAAASGCPNETVKLNQSQCYQSPWD